MTGPIDAASIIDGVTRLAAKLNEAKRQLDNANRINQEMAAAATRLERENAKLRAAQYPTASDAELSAAIARITDVVTMQIDVIGSGSAVARTADIRRRQVAKGYTPEHDLEHQATASMPTLYAHPLVGAAVALIRGNSDYWPRGWGREMFARLFNDPDRLCHAAALLCAQDDAEKLAVRRANQDTKQGDQ